MKGVDGTGETSLKLDKLAALHDVRGRGLILLGAISDSKCCLRVEASPDARYARLVSTIGRHGVRNREVFRRIAV